MVTGVSLKGADAALVLLRQVDANFHPIALAIKGNYNRLGSIDGIEEDANTELVWNYFQARLQDGCFVADAAYLEHSPGWPVEDVEGLLACFERNINDNDTAAVLDGRPVVFALIAKAIWNSLARSAPAPRGLETQDFQHLFGDVPVAEEIYRGKLPDIATHLGELSAVTEFLRERGIAWKPADDPSQDYAEEMRQYLADARETFSDSPVVLDGLKRYEREVRELLDDED
jgi:hypothetical protein